MSRRAVSCEHLASLAHFDVVSLPSKPSSSLLIRNCQDWRYRNGHGNEMVVRLMTVSYVAIKLDWST
jgi:hypothetical protein